MLDRHIQLVSSVGNAASVWKQNRYLMRIDPDPIVEQSHQTPKEQAAEDDKLDILVGT